VGLHHAAEGVWGDLCALQKPALEADAVERGDVLRLAVAEMSPSLLDDLGDLLNGHLARDAAVRADARMHGGDAVFLVTGVPGLDRAPGELEALAVLVGERLLGDVVDAGDDARAGGEFDRAEHAHLQVGADSFHGTFLLWI